MTTRTELRTELAQRLGDTANAVWTVGDLNGYINFGIKGIYPSLFQFNIAVTTAGNGPLQVAPTGARRLHSIGYQRANSTRVRPLRGWTEGDGNAFIPKTSITGHTLVWSWTSGWDAPASDSDQLTIPLEAEEIVIIRAQLSALEKLLTDRVSAEKYYALQVRPAASEDDIATAIDALHASLRERLDRLPPPPEVNR